MRLKLNKANVAIIALSLIILLFIGICASQCGRGGVAVKPVYDTIFIDTVPPQKAKSKPYQKTKRSKKKGSSKMKTKKIQKPSQRVYLDEIVNNDSIL